MTGCRPASSIRSHPRPAIRWRPVSDATRPAHRDHVGRRGNRRLRTDTHHEARRLQQRSTSHRAVAHRCGRLGNESHLRRWFTVLHMTVTLRITPDLRFDSDRFVAFKDSGNPGEYLRARAVKNVDGSSSTELSWKAPKLLSTGLMDAVGVVSRRQRRAATALLQDLHLTGDIPHRNITKDVLEEIVRNQSDEAAGQLFGGLPERGESHRPTVRRSKAQGQVSPRRCAKKRPDTKTLPWRQSAFVSGWTGKGSTLPPSLVR